VQRAAAVSRDLGVDPDRAPVAGSGAAGDDDLAAVREACSVTLQVRSSCLRLGSGMIASRLGRGLTITSSPPPPGMSGGVAAWTTVTVAAGELSRPSPAA
jgi:hypothetical protein